MFKIVPDINRYNFEKNEKLFGEAASEKG